MPPCGLLHGGIAQGAALRKLRFAVAEGPVLPPGFDQIDHHVGLWDARVFAEIASDSVEEGIATNILTDRLKHLEAERVAEKSCDPGNRRSFIYSLTQKGRDLAPIILEFVIWSGAYDDRPYAMRDVLEKVQSDRAGFEAQLRAGESG